MEKTENWKISIIMSSLSDKSLFILEQVGLE